MIQTSDEFNAAQQSDSAQYLKQINLVTRNYANAAFGAVATASDTDTSGYYPPAGAIDGDRTKINIGAPTSADNGIGLSSWSSRYAPDGSGSTWFLVTLPAAQNISRIKLYNLAANPLTSYVIQYWDPGTSTWIIFAGTADKFSPPYTFTTGYGQGQYGYGPYGGGNNGWPHGGPNGGLDYYDFPAFYTNQIKVIIYATQTGGTANIVELEAYYVKDITSYATGFSVDRKKDMKQKQPIATQVNLTVDNSTRFFSPSYSPTAAEIAAGYINAEMGALGMDIEVFEGYNTALGPELIQTFVGSVDSLTPQSSSAKVDLVVRDYTKYLINLPDDSCGLKTHIDITEAIRYLLNRANISDYEMNLYPSGITLDYFLTYQTSILTSIQQLTQAAGDAMFYFDENGIATFEFYLNGTYNSFTGAGQPYWLTGSLTNIDAYSNIGWIQRLWEVFDDFKDGKYSGRDFPISPEWTVGSGSWSAATGELVNTGGYSNITTPCSVAVGAWQYIYRITGLNYSNHAILYFINSNTALTGNGYFIDAFKNNGGGYIQYILKKYTGGSTTTLGTPYTAGIDSTNHTVRVTRDSFGNMVVYVDGVSRITATDNSYTSSVCVGLYGYAYDYPDTSKQVVFDNVYAAKATAQNIWISPVIDRGAAVTKEGIFTATDSSPAGTSISYYAIESDDNINWDAPVPLINGGASGTAAKRYYKIQAVLNCLYSTFLTPSIVQIIVSWYFGTGSNKWTSAINFYLRYDKDIIDLQEQVSDTLGGDTAVINYETVSTSPLILGGADSDTTWQGTTISPVAAISAGNPLSVTVGTLVYNLDISGGMDISKMAGGTCIVMTLGTATATAAITYIHPTKPILTITVTGGGTITDLRLIGKTFQNAATPYQAIAQDATSIALHKKRSDTISNNYIINSNIALLVANKIVANQKDVAKWIPQIDIIPLLNMQPGDQVFTNEINVGIYAGYYVIGYTRNVQISDSDASLDMTMALMRIP